MIDTHAHVFHRGLAFSPQRRYTPTYDARPDTYLSLLDRHGITHGVLVPISIVGNDNSFLVETVQSSGGRLRGFATLDPAFGANQVAELAAEGLSGMRLNLAGQPLPDLLQGNWPSILRECRRHEWIVEVNDRAARLPQILPSLLAAGLRVVLDHFGHPDKVLGMSDPGFAYICSLATTGQVWVKLSAPYRIGHLHAAAGAARLREAFGTSRLMWASDWPFTGHETSGIDYATTCGYLSDWLPGLSDRLQVAVVTPAALFGFTQKVPV
ncbi:MAG: amidohydrolase family protein [Polaromonas sp.]|nr:amidohydrolase family protein [Polaromonas sp.]